MWRLCFSSSESKPSVWFSRVSLEDFELRKWSLQEFVHSVEHAIDVPLWPVSRPNHVLKTVQKNECWKC